MKSSLVRTLLQLVVVASLIPPKPPKLQAQNPPAAPAAAPAAAVRPHEQAPSLVAVRRNGAIAIDGKMDEAAWQAATPATNFIQYDPNEGQPASELDLLH